MKKGDIIEVSEPYEVVEIDYVGDEIRVTLQPVEIEED